MTSSLSSGCAVIPTTKKIKKILAALRLITLGQLRCIGIPMVSFLTNEERKLGHRNKYEDNTKKQRLRVCKNFILKKPFNIKQGAFISVKNEIKCDLVHSCIL